MNQDNKKYTLKEGRVIGNNIINYGGFPKSINENINLDNLQQSEILQIPSKETLPTLNLKDTGNTPTIPPPGRLPPGRVPPIGNTPEWSRWWYQWQLLNSPQPFPGESREHYLERRNAYEQGLWEQMQRWMMQPH